MLDRTKEPGSAGEPLYLDVVTAIARSCEVCRATARDRRTVRSGEQRVHAGHGGRGVRRTATTEARAIISWWASTTTCRIAALTYDPAFSTEDPETVRAVFYGLGADGTVGANKNSIKIIGEDTDNYAQGYFVYDSKKSGAMTISHLRFGRKPIRASYLISRASFVACHQFSFLERMDVLRVAEPGATFLLNSPFGPDEVWDHLPRAAQQQIIEKRLRFYVIDAYRVAKDNGMGGRINTVMQTCFFALSGALPREEAIAAIKHAIAKTYGKRGEAVVQKNYAAVDARLGASV